MHQPARYLAFLLRLWSTGGANPGWRASLEDPHTHEMIGFASLEALIDFLRQRCPAIPPEAPDAPGPPPPSIKQ